MDDFTRNIILAVLGILGSLAVSWLTVRGARGNSKDTAQTAREIAESASIDKRIELIFEAYKAERAADDAKIAYLEQTVKSQGLEIENLKALFPKYRACIRRLRRLLENAGVDPGPWPEGL